MQRQLTETRSQLSEKEQLLAITKDAIKQNEVSGGRLMYVIKLFL